MYTSMSAMNFGQVNVFSLYLKLNLKYTLRLLKNSMTVGLHV